MSNITVVVIIATSMHRTKMLERSLGSVYSQVGVNPACVYVVDDNDDLGEHENIKATVKSLRERFFPKKHSRLNGGLFHTTVLRNSRTKGRSGSGAWNTAATHAFQHYAKQGPTYIALLDDDDAWEQNYLIRCVEEVQHSIGYIPAVISGFYRCQGQAKQVINIKPKDLTQEAFYIGNPGWQGSNTFVELQTFWKAGGFDESMLSTHDRDLAIRILDVCQHELLSIKIIKEPLVFHYVHDGPRVTTCMHRKHAGLERFYDKYRSRMTSPQLSASIERAHRLFSYNPCTIEPVNDELEELDVSCFEKEQPVRVIIGVASSDSANIKRQMLSLKEQIQQEAQFVNYCDYVVMTNGLDEAEIKDVVFQNRGNGFNTHCLNTDGQQNLYSEFPFKNIFQDEPLTRKSIAHSRSLLQFYCWKLADRYNKECVVMILDDDLTFETVTIQEQSLKTTRLNFLGKLASLYKASTADLLVSGYTDAPPLPFYSSMRTQLLDVLYSLHLFRSKGGGTSAKFGIENLSKVIKAEDYYYDLSSSRFAHLEHAVPWHGIDQSADQTSVSLFKSFLQDICCLGHEANITRPLLLNKKQWGFLDGEVTHRRGGIAIYLDLDLLASVPNLSACVGINNHKRRTRRSDFVAAIAMTNVFGKCVKKVEFPLRHNRREQNKPCEISANKLADDVIGLCFYRAFNYKLMHGDVQNEQLIKLFHDHVQECLAKMRLNNLRSLQLLEQIRLLLSDSQTWWNNYVHDSELIPFIELAKENLNLVKHEFAIKNMSLQIEAVNQRVASFDLIHEISSIHETYQRLSNAQNKEAA